MNEAAKKRAEERYRMVQTPGALARVRMVEELTAAGVEVKNGPDDWAIGAALLELCKLRRAAVAKARQGGNR